MSKAEKATKVYRGVKTLICLTLCTLATIAIQGCWHPKGVVARRLGARWNALNMTQSTELVGRVPDDWTAGVFISTSVLENFANLADKTEIAYAGDDKLLKGTKITLQQIHFESQVGEMLANIDAKIVGPHPFGEMSVSIHGDLRFVGTTALDATSNEVVFRVEPTDIEDKDHGILSLFFSARRKYLTRLLADITLANIQESRLLIKIPLPATIHVDDTSLNKTFRDAPVLKDTPILSATATINVSITPTTITEPFPFSAMLPRKSGIWVVAGQNPKTTSAYVGPGTVLDSDMKDILAYLNEIGSPLATLPLPPSKKVLEDTMATLEHNLAKRYAAEPTDEISPGKPTPAQPSAIYAFVSGRAVENVLQEFEARPADVRTLTFASTSTGGHLREAAVLKDAHLGDYQFYAELRGADAIRGTVVLNFQNTKWTKSGLSGTITYDANATIQAHIQIQLGILDQLPELGKLVKDVTGANVEVKGTSKELVPFSLNADLVQKGGAKADVLAPEFECKIINIDLMTGADVGIRIHYPSLPEQPAPLPIVKSHEYFLPLVIPSTEPNPTWVITPGANSADGVLTPIAYRPTDDGLFVEATLIATPSKAEPNSKDETALKNGINSRNTLNDRLIAQAFQTEPCGLTPSVEVLLGSIGIETKTFLKTIEDVIAEANRIIGGAKKVVETAAVKVKEAAAAVDAAVKLGDKDAEKQAREAGAVAQKALDDANVKIAVVDKSLHGVENTKDAVVSSVAKGATKIWKKVF